MALCLNNLGVGERKRGDVARAEALLREALALYGEQGNPTRCAMVLESLAETAGVAGQAERAARLWGAAAALHETLGAPHAASNQAALAHDMATARATLGDVAWAAAFAAGHALSLEQAIAEALGNDTLVTSQVEQTSASGGNSRLA